MLIFHSPATSIEVLKNICSKNLIQRNCNRNIRSVNFPCKCEFSLKIPIISMSCFERCFSRILATDKKTHCKEHVLQNSHFWTKLPLAACWTFLLLKFVCTWLLILYAVIQSLKESFFRFFSLNFSIWNVEFAFFSYLQGFSKCACISNFLGNRFLTLWTWFITEFI